MNTDNEELIKAIANLHHELLATRGALWEIAVKAREEKIDDRWYIIEGQHVCDVIINTVNKHKGIELMRFKLGLNEIHPAIKDYMKNHKMEDYIDYGR